MSTKQNSYLVQLNSGYLEFSAILAKVSLFRTSSFEKKVMFCELFPNFDILVTIWNSLENKLIYTFLYMHFLNLAENRIVYLRKTYTELSHANLSEVLSGSFEFEKKIKYNLLCDDPVSPELYTRVRLISPFKVSKENVRKSSIIFHIHGGGFIAHTSYCHQCYLNEIAQSTGMPILSVDYSLAPAKAYPYSLNEVFQAYKWFLDNSKMLGLEADKIFLMGDSAGGNLCAALVNLLLLTNDILPDEVFLFYPALNLSRQNVTLSNLISLDDFLLPYFLLEYIILSYGNGYTNDDDFLFNPIAIGDKLLRKWPKVTFYTSEKDSIRDYSVKFYNRLLKMEKETKMYMVIGMPHGFLNFNMPIILPEIAEVYKILIDELIEANM